jgi:hypothetical protein
VGELLDLVAVHDRARCLTMAAALGEATEDGAA